MSAFDLVRIARATGAKLSVDSGSLVLEADNPPPQEVFDGLRAHKAEILELLREERRAIVMWINDHFKSSPPGRCAHCGGATSADDPFVKMFVDEDRADVHASCHPAWVAEQEGEARVALGIETSAGIRPECDASCIETKGEMKTSPSQQTIANRVDCVAGALTVQQAEKSPVGAERFLQIAKRNPQKKRHKLTRVPFQVSRLMEFCSLRELQNQTGHNVLDWPLVVLKELLDNALDACEEVAVAPVVKVSVSPKTGTIVIEDNGPGIPEETVRAVCDYTIRVSSREAYVSPSRGAQGNALKTILAMGYPR